VTFASNSSGAFSPSGCTLTLAKCSFVYNPESGGEGVAMVTASYGGDTNHTSSAGIIMIAVTQRPAAISISCSPSSVAVGASTICAASVTDQGTSASNLVPSGTVEFFASGGTFSPAANCQLSAGGCYVNFTPNYGSEGAIQVDGTYLGDVDHSRSSASPITIYSNQRTVAVAVSCSPSSTLGGSSVTCTATVSDTGAGAFIQPTGTVTFDDGGFGGSFSSISCTLSSGSCSVTYTPPIVLFPSTATITASYSGDTDHNGGSGATSLQVS
jgi:hypothetical protein